jgi:MurNAc alpha-1-phosphate uridylyltransferase
MSVAMILAAGRGERMRPLSDATPKPLLHAGGKRLIGRHLDGLARAGVHTVVINTSHLPEQFAPALAEVAPRDQRIVYSYEGAEPLETGGGMLRALPLLGPDPFIAVNGDICCDMDFSTLPHDPDALAHLVLVDNPPQHPRGDFGLDGARVTDTDMARLTFTGIGVYRPAILDGWRAIVGAAPGSDATPPRFKLAPLLRAAMRQHAVTGVHYRGAWTDVGTPERLQQLDQALRARPQA